uniref:Uncharacterized protein n=1 Tax=Bracon brevicornis TaxID=1563983 RepID=A0A6V7K700_9HYME
MNEGQGVTNVFRADGLQNGWRTAELPFVLRSVTPQNEWKTVEAPFVLTSVVPQNDWKTVEAPFVLTSVDPQNVWKTAGPLFVLKNVVPSEIVSKKELELPRSDQILDLKIVELLNAVKCKGHQNNSAESVPWRSVGWSEPQLAEKYHGLRHFVRLKETFVTHAFQPPPSVELTNGTMITA